MAQFIDQAQITVRSGDGGNGVIAWRREKYEPMGGPAGGNGGRGGHVYLEATRDLNTLLEFRYKAKFQADNGERGRSKGMHGKQGDDLTIKVPVGTVVIDKEDGHVVGDLVREGQRVLVAEGGRGGRGNAMLASPTRRAPHFCEPGERGIERNLTLELKLLADVGIVGLPNAGKSTLLSVMSRARPKIADYPFSTLEPKLGVAKTPSGSTFVMADIPGLIEGASKGLGLGHDFLRHIERTSLIVHLVDINAESIDKDIDTIVNELSLYSERLSTLPRLTVLNKIDSVDEETASLIKREVENHINEKWPLSDKGEISVQLISAATRKGLDDLFAVIEKQLAEFAAQKPEEAEVEDVLTDAKASLHEEGGFAITRRKNVFYIEGDRVGRLVEVTNLREPESLTHLWHVLRVMGVVDALLKEGARQGSEVVINGIPFSLSDDLI